MKSREPATHKVRTAEPRPQKTKRKFPIQKLEERIAPKIGLQSNIIDRSVTPVINEGSVAT